jgi:predicted ribosome quality control (RQC) complex YloA/Tae2 family protein
MDREKQTFTPAEETQHSNKETLESLTEQLHDLDTEATILATELETIFPQVDLIKGVYERVQKESGHVEIETLLATLKKAAPALSEESERVIRQIFYTTALRR